MTKPLLELTNLRTYFHTDIGTVKAVDDLTVKVLPGQTLGIVGESGSGKSVTSFFSPAVCLIFFNENLKC